MRNVDLWKELDALACGHQVKWHWIKGHAGHPLNERCDQLAVQEIRKLRSRHQPQELARALAMFREKQAK